MRETIINALESGLGDNPRVFALWLEGADAMGTVDAYSDMDVWIDVQDGEEEKILREVARILSTLGTLDLEHEEEHPHPKIRQKFFHLKGTPEFLIVDVCVQSHSREFWFTKGFAGEKVKVVFDKGGVVQFRDMDEQQFKKETTVRIKELKETYGLFHIWVEKEIKRKDFLQALGYYHSKILKPLIEMARMKTDPTKRDFYLKHISSDLPPNIVQDLEGLFIVTSLEDLTAKVRKADELFAAWSKEATHKLGVS